MRTHQMWQQGDAPGRRHATSPCTAAWQRRPQIWTALPTPFQLGTCAICTRASHGHLDVQMLCFPSTWSVRAAHQRMQSAQKVVEDDASEAHLGKRLQVARM